MDDQNDEERQPRAGRPTVEGVRIIGAEEAQAAIEAGQVAGRRPDDAPRFGDVPEQPTGPRPPLRFPLGGDADPSSVPRPPLQANEPGETTEIWAPEPDDEPEFEPVSPVMSTPQEPEPPEPVITTGSMELPHWTEPPSGENPRIVVEGAEESEDDLRAWSSVNQGPRWRDQASDWDDAGDEGLWAPDDETRVGALDTGRSESSDLFSFDEPAFDDEEPEPEPTFIRTRARAPEPAPAEPPHGLRAGAGRDVGTAVATGLGVAAVLLLTLKLFHNVGGAVLAAVVLVLAEVELLAVLRQRGFRPATLLGIVGTASLSWAAYARGEQALPLVMALFVVFALLWYLAGVEDRQPTMNTGASILAFAYVGLLGSFAALLLRWPPFHAHGMGLFLGAIIGTVAYDVGGFFIGSRLGRSPMAPAISPNKTWEGLIGGCGLAFFASAVITAQIDPWSLNRGIALGIVIAIAAPLGDLCESMIKRDLGVKDMGAVLPGHGGVLDRIDALLFVVPATYYLAKFLKIT